MPACMPLKPYYKEDTTLEIGIDEAGRGPMLGRVYTAAVILPKNTNSFKHEEMKDSKRFHSFEKISQVAEYIKENAIAWCVTYHDEKTIDKINIREATISSMHNAITEIIAKHHDCLLLVDGCDFKPYMVLNHNTYTQMPHVCIEGGDNKYTCIAAASILAKVARDQYIMDLCKEHPVLSDIYQIHKNKGYGTKVHLDAIKRHGITQWHRATYGICKDANVISEIN